MKTKRSSDKSHGYFSNMDPASNEIISMGQFGGRESPNEFDPGLMVPFAPRWLNIKRPWDGGNNIRHKRNYLFGLGWQRSLWNYFPVAAKGSFLNDLDTQWDELVAHAPLRAKSPSERLLAAQPVWKGNRGVMPVVEQRTKPRLAAAPEKRCSLEPAGRYVPAHFGDPSEYGIHLSPAGLVQAAARIHEFCPEQPREVVLAAFCHFAYCHLVAHAWIEDICALTDFHYGCPEEHARRPYALAHRRHGPLLLLEETACNTMAFGLLFDFLGSLHKVTVAERCIPVFDRVRILAAVDAWIKQHFDPRAIHIPTTCAPQRSRQLFNHLEFLLCHVYLYREYQAYFIAEQFLGFENEDADPEEQPRDFGLNVADNYPVRIAADES